MLIWHYKLIPVLPRQQLLQLHRVCCCFRGKGWNKEHKKCAYIFQWNHLYQYHMQVLNEMENRKYQPNQKWKDFYYRGKSCKALQYNWFTPVKGKRRYAAHDNGYLHNCLMRLLETVEKGGESKYKKEELTGLYAFSHSVFSKKTRR